LFYREDAGKVHIDLVKNNGNWEYTDGTIPSQTFWKPCKTMSCLKRLIPRW